MRRSRPLVVVAGLLVAGLVLLSWTQTWFTLQLDATSAVVSSVTADGSVAASSYSALAIASLALFLALTIAGPVVRIVLAAIEILLGVAVVGTGVSALADPIAASSSAVGGVAGVSDVDAVRRIVTSTTTTPWPYVGIAAGVLAALLGVLVLVVQRRWPGPSRKYGESGSAARKRAAAELPRDAVVDWDDLSAGVDPTDGSAPTGVETTERAARGTAATDPAPVDPVGSNTRRPTGGATENEEHREQH